MAASASQESGALTTALLAVRFENGPAFAGSPRCELTDHGRRIAVVFTKTYTYTRILNPYLAELEPTLPDEITQRSRHPRLQLAAPLPRATPAGRRPSPTTAQAVAGPAVTQRLLTNRG